jgi:hypothetical protein
VKTWNMLVRPVRSNEAAGQIASTGRNFYLPRRSPPLSLLPLPFGPEIFGNCPIFGQIAVAASRIGN